VTLTWTRVFSLPYLYIFASVLRRIISGYSSVSVNPFSCVIYLLNHNGSLRYDFRTSSLQFECCDANGCRL